MSFLTSPLLHHLPLKKKPSEVFVAYSGGMDSSVLLHKLFSEIKHSGIKLNAIHINHQLSSKSQQWQEHCAEECKKYNISFYPLSVHISQQPRKGLERKAREERFEGFVSILPKNGVLALAHHQQDQAETVLLQLLRGGGLGALSGMQNLNQYKHFFLWRPLLAVKKQEIEQYADENGLAWIEDDSNENTEIRRNFLRKEVLPRIEQSWHGAAKRLANCADWANIEQQALNHFLNQKQQEIRRPPLPFAMWSLAKKEFKALPQSVAFLLLKRVLEAKDVRLLKSHLQEVQQQCMGENAEHVLFSKKEEGEGVVLCARKESLSLYPFIKTPEQLDELSFLDEEQTPIQENKQDLLGKQGLFIRPRQGGERVQIGEKSLSLKSWYKQQKVPRCWRKLPLLYREDTLLGVCGLVLFEAPQTDGSRAKTDISTE